MFDRLFRKATQLGRRAAAGGRFLRWKRKQDRRRATASDLHANSAGTEKPDGAKFRWVVPYDPEKVERKYDEWRFKHLIEGWEYALEDLSKVRVTIALRDDFLSTLGLTGKFSRYDAKQLIERMAEEMLDTILRHDLEKVFVPTSKIWKCRMRELSWEEASWEEVSDDGAIATNTVYKICYGYVNDLHAHLVIHERVAPNGNGSDVTLTAYIVPERASINDCEERAKIRCALCGKAHEIWDIDYCFCVICQRYMCENCVIDPEKSESICLECSTKLDLFEEYDEEQ
jgi:hypothetical protein